VKQFQVKVCGITRPGDALLAAELGADLIGLIFYRKSPRWVSQRLAAELIRALPPTVSRVGLFVDESVDKMLRVASALRLDYVQLHGNEAVSDITKLQQAGFRVIKAFSISHRDDFVAVENSKADLRLVDHKTINLPGGTGVPFDWSLKPRRKIANLMLAGGISIDNLARGVELFSPMVVDVNSGVESKPGVKSKARLKAFFAECDRLRYGA
jgi:phosphoribosylanthranilate isomerase